MLPMRPAARSVLTFTLAAVCAALCLSHSGHARKVTYTTGPIGTGPAGFTGYTGPEFCGSLGLNASDPLALIWFSTLRSYNDSNLNPQLAPVTGIEIRPMKTIKFVWANNSGIEHGLVGLTQPFPSVLKLRPGEVITAVSWTGNTGRDGRMTDFSVTTNASRVWTPAWPYPPQGKQTPFVAAPPTAAEWTGPPIQGDWYLAYTWAEPVGYCCKSSNNNWCYTPQQLELNLLEDEGPRFFFTPKMWFVWAADVAPTPLPTPSTLPGPKPRPPATPSSSSPAPNTTGNGNSFDRNAATTTTTKKKSSNLGVIAGAAGGGVAILVLLAVLGFCFVRRRGGKDNAVATKDVLPVTVVAAGLGQGDKAAVGVAPAGVGTVAAGAVAGGAAAGEAAGERNAVADDQGAPPSSFIPTAAKPPSPVDNSNLAPSPSIASAVHPVMATYTAATTSVPSKAHTSDRLPPSERLYLSEKGAGPASSFSGSHSSAGAVISTHRRAVAAGPHMPGGVGTAGGGAMPLAVMGAAGLALGSAIVLAREILDAGDRVVANHTRCLRLTSRIHSILPLLNSLQDHLNREAQEKGNDDVQYMQGMLDSMAAVFNDVKSCINRWCGSEASAPRSVMLQVLRNLAMAKRFEDEFMDLNERLSSCYQDLILTLNIKHALREEDPDRLREQYEQDAAADLQGVAEELTTAEGEDAWNQLPSEEKQVIREAFGHYGLNFNTLLAQARKNAVGDRVKDLMIPWTDLTLTAEIGSGGYGTVYRGTWQDIDVAVKKLQLTVVTERARRELSHEAYVMSLLRHPNVATSYGMVLQPPHCALVMKFYKKGTLLELLHDDTQPLTLRRKLQLASDVAKGMAYLHNRPTDAVIHGDLKPSNLLIDDNGKVVIADFGLAKISTLTLTTRPSSSAMSITYAAPEILADPTCKRAPAVDVYAYGLVLFEIFTRELPFESASDVMAVVQYVLGGGRPKVVGAEFDELRVPKEVVQLMQECWNQVPQARPSFPQIVDKLKSVQVL